MPDKAADTRKMVFTVFPREGQFFWHEGEPGDFEGRACHGPFPTMEACEEDCRLVFGLETGCEIISVRKERKES
jgi:hypothetical protein